MHILVTGGAGYIGSTLVPLLLQASHRVTVVDRLYFGMDSLGRSARAHGDALRVMRADVRRLDPAAFTGVDAVVDLAGIANDPACELDPELTRSINLDGALSTGRAALAAGVRRFVFASSCSVYGHGQQNELDEDAATHPVSLYAHCKREAERGLLALGGDMKVTVLRLATLFGRSGRTRFDLAVNLMTKTAYVDRSINIEGGGRQWRPLVHVSDAADAFARVLSAAPERFAGRVLNVGATRNNFRIINLAYLVRDLIPGTEVTVAPTDPDRRDYHVSFERIRKELDFEPRHSVEDGVREILDGLRAGEIDPEDRRCYTLLQFQFLQEVELTFQEVALDGKVLA